MTHTKKNTIYLLLCTLFINHSLSSYPVLGEFYRFTNQNLVNTDYESGHNILILVDNNTQTNARCEREFKNSVIPIFRKLLSDNEVNIILENRLDSLCATITKVLDIWRAEFEADPQWDAIIEQNYSNTTASTIAYKKMSFSPKEATKLFVLISKMKNYIHDLPLKDHLGFVQKIGPNKDNNLFKSCRSAKDYFKLGRQSTRGTAEITLADWRTPNIITIMENYQNGLEALSKDLYLIDKQSWPNFIEDLARAFVPQDTTATSFSPLDTLRAKDLLDDLDVILKKLDVLEMNTSIDLEQKLWSGYKEQIQKAKEYVLNALAIFKNLSAEDKNSFEQLFNKMPKYHYSPLHWFAIVYAYMLKDKNPENSIYSDGDTNEWTKILNEDLVHMGLMNALLDSKNKKTKAIVYLNKDTHQVISQNLLALGYDKILSCNNLGTDSCILTHEIQELAHQFPVNISRIANLLEKPLTYSIRI